MTSSDAPVRALFARAALSLVVVGLLGGASCSGASRGGEQAVAERAEAPSLGRPDARLVVITDLEGYLEPCGCTSRPLGGIDRMAAEIARLRGDGVPTVVVSAGDLLFDGGGDYHVDRPGAETQEIWKAETLVDILSRVGLAAAVPGGLDLRFGPRTFARLAERAAFPLLGAGVRVSVPAEPAASDAAPRDADPLEPTPATATLALPAHVIVTAGSLRVGLVGVSDMSVAGRRDGAVEAPADLVARAAEATRAARADGADVVVVLVRGPRRDARRIASQVEGVDFVVEGGLDEASAHLPSVAAHGVLLHAGRQGQSLVVVDLYRRERGRSWTDLSTWTREAERARISEQAAALRQRIAAWEQDPDADADDVAEQRARLAELEAEARALVAVPQAPGHAFVARLVELAPEAPRDAEVTRILADFDRRVNLHNREAFLDWQPSPAAAGQPTYVGSVRCGSCHEAELRWWRGTAHGRAYATLVERNKQYNLSCVGCHVTGYNRPGGSTVSHVGVLEDVGCESCHGPGSLHVADPAHATVNVWRETNEGTCLGCHTPEHSDTFHYEAYRQTLIVPGHGLPAPGER